MKKIWQCHWVKKLLAQYLQTKRLSDRSSIKEKKDLESDRMKNETHMEGLYSIKTIQIQLRYYLVAFVIVKLD